MFHMDRAAIHFIVDLHHWRAVEIPRKTMAHRASAHQFIGHERVDIKLCIELYGGRVFPCATQRGHSALHLAQHPDCLGAQAARAGIAARDDVVAVVARPSGASPLPATTKLSGASGAVHEVKQNV